MDKLIIFLETWKPDWCRSWEFSPVTDCLPGIFPLAIHSTGVETLISRICWLNTNSLRRPCSLNSCYLQRCNGESWLSNIPVLLEGWFQGRGHCCGAGCGVRGAPHPPCRDSRAEVGTGEQEFKCHVHTVDLQGCWILTASLSAVVRMLCTLRSAHTKAEVGPASRSTSQDNQMTVPSHVMPLIIL